MCSGTRTEAKKKARKKTKSATKGPWPPSLRIKDDPGKETVELAEESRQLSPPDRFSYPCSRFLRAKEIVYVVKNIAYATEEETLMGNGVNLRTLTNDGGSAVISDYMGASATLGPGEGSRM